METKVAGFKPFALERYFAQHEFSVTYNLAASDCETITMQALLELASAQARSLWDNLSLGYTRAEGLTELREVIAGDYATGRPDDVLTVVPVEGIYLCMRALVEAGDEVIVPWPSYQSLHEVAEASGASIKAWRPDLSLPVTSADFFSLETLRSLVSDKTRVIVVNFPHNPTGATISHARWTEILQIASEVGAYVLSDEMYRGLEHAGVADRLRAAYDSDYDRAISLCGLSKRHGLPGLRTGWVATRHKALMTQLKTLKDYTTICAPGPAEVLALIGMEAQDFLTERSLQTILHGFDRWDGMVQAYPGLLRSTRPKAGPIAFPKFTHPSMTVDAFAAELVEKLGLLVLPGSVYDVACEGHFRVGLGRTSAGAAISSLDTFLAEL